MAEPRDVRLVQPVSADLKGYREPTGFDEKPKTESEKEEARKRDLLTEALERWKLVNSAEDGQRARELEDLKFFRGLPEDQWPDNIRKERAGGIAPDGRTVLAERPCLVINKIDPAVTQTINEARRARLAIQIKAKTNASAEDAELRQGMIRAIEVDSRASLARMWAFERAAQCGRGYYRVEKKYALDGDFDLDLAVGLIPNQGSVYLDPRATELDKRDGEFAFITEDMPRSTYERKFGEAPEATGEQFTSINDRAPGWVDKDTIRVAEYFYVVTTQRELLALQDGTKVFADEIKKGDPRAAMKTIRRRTVDVRTVKWCYISAFQILKEEDWQGSLIPIMPVIGKAYNVDGEWVYKGIVSNSKDSQRLYNYGVSAEAIAVGSAPMAPYIAAEGQTEPYKHMWDTANTKNYAVLPYKATTHEGNLVPPPQRNYGEPPIAAIAQLVQQASEDIKATTGRFDPSLGAINSSDRSGKAIRELKQQAEMGSSNYLSNLAEISMRYEAEVLLDLMPIVYDTPGRIVKLLGEEESDERRVMINAPFVTGPDGQPMPAPPQPPAQPPQPPGVLARMGQMIGMGPQPPQAPQPPQPEVKHYDLKKGQYSVVVSVGPSYQTQREENVAVLQSVMENAPDVTPNILDLVAENMEGPMGTKIAERLRAINPALRGQEQADLPPAAQAIVQQMEQQVQQLQQELQEAQQAVATNQAKQQASIQVAQTEAQTRMQMAQLEAQTRSQIEQAKAQADIAIARLKAEAEIAKVRAQLTSDEEIARFDAAMKKTLQDDEQAHEVALTKLKAAEAQHSADRADAMSASGDVRKAALTTAQSREAADREDARAEREASREDTT